MVHKVINDPIYGFIRITHPLILKIIQHPCFQRLHQIKQLGLAHFVYPGAVHTRLHHTLGTYHLMCLALDTLRKKDVPVSEEEALAAQIAILTHDTGHTPFSHTLESVLLPDVSHEKVSEYILGILKKECASSADETRIFTMAQSIFLHTYERPFFSQLIASQLDVDRMDYLSRDSFYTGVAEGKIGYDRIIQMLHVQGGRLVVESKGLYPVEKLIMARYFMYWQVYLHKNVWALGALLEKTFQRAQALIRQGHNAAVHSAHFLYLLDTCRSTRAPLSERIAALLATDDNDVWVLIKSFALQTQDKVLVWLARALLERKRYRITILDSVEYSPPLAQLQQMLAHKQNISREESAYLVFEAPICQDLQEEDEVLILFKGQEVKPISQTYHSLLAACRPQIPKEKIYRVQVFCEDV